MAKRRSIDWYVETPSGTRRRHDDNDVRFNRARMRAYAREHGGKRGGYTGSEYVHRTEVRRTRMLLGWTERTMAALDSLERASENDQLTAATLSSFALLATAARDYRGAAEFEQGVAVVYDHAFGAIDDDEYHAKMAALYRYAVDNGYFDPQEDNPSDFWRYPPGAE